MNLPTIPPAYKLLAVAGLLAAVWGWHAWDRSRAEDAAYAPYLARQDSELRDLRASEALPLGDAFPYAAIPGLSREMVERLQRARPATLGGAVRACKGVTCRPRGHMERP